MADAHAGRNLLIGIVALQMNLISREHLVEAVRAWSADKSRSMAQILVDRGALKRGECSSLKSMVKEYLQLYDNNADDCLAGLSSIGSIRRELDDMADSDLQASLSRVAAGPSSGVVPSTRMPSADALAHWKERFRILRPHARGGLGEVYVAHDEELNRNVALKEIQARYADNPGSRARFLREAEITGGLEHPGIVPVYGLGTYVDGRPYYAMRFIKGESLKDALERFHASDGPRRDRSERELAFRKLLRRFVDVCNAIGYAHSRGVLHRDLKPANIMLGPYGETLVVDWGLAKSVGRPDRPGGRSHRSSDDGTLRPSESAELTFAGSTLGTPAYMSPEQASGQLERLGPAADVYSLGATLYSILTGHAPFEGNSPGVIIQLVIRGEYPSPSEVAARVPRPLEAVCLKAMELEPEARYTAARDLADDLEHWMADEPVSVYREPAAVRLLRWGRRHQTLLAAATVLLVSATLGLAGFSAIAEARRRDASQNAAAQDLLRADAEEKKKLAQSNEALALRNAEEASKSAKEAHENAKKASESAEVARLEKRKAEKEMKGREKAVAAVEEVTRKKEQEVQAKQEALEGEERERRGRLAAQANTEAAEAGKQQVEGERAAERENAQLEKDQLLSLLSNTLGEHGVLLSKTGNPAAGATLLNNALAMYNNLVASYPGNLQYQFDRARLYAYAGRVQGAAGQFDQARGCLITARDLLDQLLQGNPESGEVRQFRESVVGDIRRHDEFIRTEALRRTQQQHPPRGPVGSALRAYEEAGRIEQYTPNGAIVTSPPVNIPRRSK